MYYFPAHKIGFFHIPKTGGTAFSKFIIKAMRERGDNEREITLKRWHEPLEDKMKVLDQPVFSENVFLTTIRNPYAVVVSLYFWCKKKADEQHFDLKDYPDTEKVAKMDFPEYIDWYMENDMPFERYFLKDGKIPDNLRILRIERIDVEARAVLNDELGLSIDVSVPVANATRHGPVMSYLDDDAVRRINQKYAWSFEHFYRDAMIMPGETHPGLDIDKLGLT